MPGANKVPSPAESGVVVCEEEAPGGSADGSQRDLNLGPVGAHPLRGGLGFLVQELLESLVPLEDAARWELAGLASQLRMLLQGAAHDLTPSASGRFLKNLISLLGLKLEANPGEIASHQGDAAEAGEVSRTIRPLLIALSDRLEALLQETPEDGSGLARHLTRCLNATRALLHHLGSSQLGNIVEENRLAWTLQIPMAWPQESTTVHLWFKRVDPGKDGGGRSAVRVVLSLKTRSLGSVRIGALVEGSRVAYQIRMEREEAVECARGALGELNERLEDAGLVVGGGTSAPTRPRSVG